MQPQSAVRAEHRDRVVQLVQRRALDLDLGVEAAAQLQLVGDVREDQQNAAQRVRLAHDAQGAPVRQRPAVVRRGLRRAIELQLTHLPAGIVDHLGQAATLAQTVQQFGMGRTFVQPGRVDVEQGLEGGIVEGQPLLRAEDGDGVGQVVQRLVMGVDVAAQGVARLFRLGHFDGEGGDGAAARRLGDDAPGAPRAPAGRPAEALLAHAQTRGLGDQGVGAAVEGHALFDGVVDALGIGLVQPGAVGPGQFSGPVHDPGRGGRGVAQQGQAAFGRIRPGQGEARRGRQPQPGRTARDPSLDPPGLHIVQRDQTFERLTFVNQGVDQSAVGDPELVQDGGSGLGVLTRQPRDQFGRTDRQTGRLPVRRQGQADVVEGAQHGVMAAEVGQGLDPLALGGDGGLMQPPTQQQGPGADGHGQSGCARCGDIGDVGLGHSCPWRRVSAPIR